MSSLLPGTEVFARGLRWSVVFSEQLGPQALVRLRGLDGALVGQEIDLLHPFERIEPVVRELQPEKAGPLANWLVYHQAFLLEQALGPDALLSVQPGRLTLEPYQLVPVLRALQMSRPRLFLADDVGLGKTIEAGLVLTELVARRIAHRILVVSPAGPLLDQWKDEMIERFGLRLQVIDRTTLEEIRRGTELGSNPFDHIPLGLASIDFLKQERVLEWLERASYDVVVIDEAHHCMDLGAAVTREDSQRRRLAEVLARRCDALLLLTATPHDGNDRSFASLCELLDPGLVDGHGVLRGERYRHHVVRRLKRHIKDKFKLRRVIPVPVSAHGARNKAFIDLHQALLDLIAPELRRAFRLRRFDDVLAFIALLKRSVSTVAACAATLGVVAERFQRNLTETSETQEEERQRLRNLRDYQRKLGRFGVLPHDEEEDRQRLVAEELALQLSKLERDVRSGSSRLKKAASVVAALDELIALAEQARLVDPKLEQLAGEIRSIRRNEPNANVLIYTEYVTSQRAVAEALEAAGLGRILLMSGEDDDKARRKITEQFRSQEGLILVSTDAAAEGLNLHYRCHHLIHLELPFNPNRLEQRNGRIDRFGQQHEPVVRYLYLRGSFEERILLRLIAKYERIRSRLTFVPNILGLSTGADGLDGRLLKGLLDEDEQLFKEDSPVFTLGAGEEVDGADEATRELLEEIDRSLKGFEKAARAHTWLGDAGLHAEESQMELAGQAQRTGADSSDVDLATFVTQAILLDNGNLFGNIGDESFQVQLPPSWMVGMEELPGADDGSNCVRLTTRLDVTSDSEKRSVGYLGRAHPLVRRGLDRVRSLSLGGDVRDASDLRVSAVAAGSKLLLVYTFLGRVSSPAGRELERVIAVEVSRDMTAEYVDHPSTWLRHARAGQAIRTGGVWRANFGEWANGASGTAHASATAGFAAAASAFTLTFKEAMATERRELRGWLARRSIEVTGAVATSRALLQGSLFEMSEGPALYAPGWSGLADPVDRIAAFARDPDQPHSRRSEADGLLRVYQRRLADLDSRMALGDPEIVPLGLLMVVPLARHGA